MSRQDKQLERRFREQAEAEQAKNAPSQEVRGVFCRYDGGKLIGALACMPSLEMAEAFTTQVVLPLLAGGKLEPLPPLGERQARELRAAFDGLEAFEQVQSFRLQAARRLQALDNLPLQFLEVECLLLVALNNLLQLTNPSLCRGVRSSSNHAELVALVSELIDRAGPPRTLAEALSRHSLFYGVTRLQRQDTKVAWWSGARDYLGAHPPARLLAWPGLRRVRTTVQSVRFDEMGTEVSSFDTLRQRWLAASPLTLFHGLGAGALQFYWTGSTLSLVSFAQGRSLAMRAILMGQRADEALQHLRHNSEELKAHKDAYRLAHDFLQELAQRKRQLQLAAVQA